MSTGPTVKVTGKRSIWVKRGGRVRRRLNGQTSWVDMRIHDVTCVSATAVFKRGVGRCPEWTEGDGRHLVKGEWQGCRRVARTHGERQLSGTCLEVELGHMGTCGIWIG